MPTLQALLRCAAEIRDNTAMQPAWSPECDTPKAPHRSCLGEMDWREEMADTVTMAGFQATPHTKHKPPFPYFGGKSRAAHLVWQRFGEVANYIEPFFGSGAVLFARPGGLPSGIETVNDLDCMVANFWRALQSAPDELAHHVDWPVNEADLHARHRWLCNQPAFRERMKTEPDYYDVRIAGWWCWGLCQWIGCGWCSGLDLYRRLPRGGTGAGGVGLASRQRPHLGDAGTGVHRNGDVIADYLQGLAERLRRVRVCCGDWSRILGPSVTTKQGMTAVFLDPPYSAEAGRDMGIYAEESGDVAHAVRAWAIANGGNPLLRIALCGYEGEHAMPSTGKDAWQCVPWKAHGGYGSQGGKNARSRENSHLERIWFSPACLAGRQAKLF